MSKFGEVIRVTVMGAVWGRPGLDYKTRTLICVVSDIATGRFPELAIHARMAMRQGWTRDELVEVALHMAAYVGAPLSREAMLTLREAFERESEEGGG
jgi:4-carboxymuconolactone decarboxylase